MRSEEYHRQNILHHQDHHHHYRGALLFRIRFEHAVRPDLKCRGCVVMIGMITAADPEDA